MVVSGASSSTLVGRLARGGALVGWIMMYDEEWTFRKKAGHRKSLLQEATVDWRIVMSEEDFTTSGHLSLAQAVVLRDHKRFEMGDLSYDVLDLANDVQREDALPKFVDSADRKKFLLRGDLAEFLREIDSARLRSS